ncbi:MAG: hypothetical protein SPH44_03590 [Eubacteriales bacterium]|nr:hypothetical protein [Eubacteriales bacterium]
MIRLMHISIWLDDLHEQTTADFLRKTRTVGLYDSSNAYLDMAR